MGPGGGLSHGDGMEGAAEEEEMSNDTTCKSSLAESSNIGVFRKARDANFPNFPVLRSCRHALLPPSLLAVAGRWPLQVQLRTTWADVTAAPKVQHLSAAAAAGPGRPEEVPLEDVFAVVCVGFVGRSPLNMWRGGGGGGGGSLNLLQIWASPPPPPLPGAASSSSESCLTGVSCFRNLRVRPFDSDKDVVGQ